jgi:hypothetical protein
LISQSHQAAAIAAASNIAPGITAALRWLIRRCRYASYYFHITLAATLTFLFH